MKYPGFTVLVMLGGCMGLAETADAPAILIDPTPALRQELATSVSRTLGVHSVTLAPDALTATNVLTVERRQIRAPDGAPLNGRELGRPEVFSLVKRGDRCFLFHAGSSTRSELKTAACRTFQSP